MLSEGRPGLDNVYRLQEGMHYLGMNISFCTLHGLNLSGQLCLELPKEIYERTGLVGRVIQDGGRKHVKTRYGASAPRERQGSVELNLDLSN